MTGIIIDDILPWTQIIASGGQTVFNTNWTVDATTDVVVYARASGEDADDATQLVSSSLYNVTLIGDEESVRVTFLSGRTAGDIITITRFVPIDRENLYSNTNFTPSMLNSDFGRVILMMQDNQLFPAQIGPRYNTSETVDVDVDLRIPKLPARCVWRMNEDNTQIEAYELADTPAPVSAPYWVSEEVPALFNEVNLGALSSGILKIGVSSGFATPAIAVAGVDYYGPGGAPVPITEGGTGASTASAARTNLGLGTIATQDANNVNITGGVANLTSGQVINSPTFDNDLVNKLYADTIASGFSFKSACFVATTATLNATYNNGASGVGATLTSNVNGAISIDGESPVLANRVLVKNMSNNAYNGIYVVTDVGSAGTPWILERATDFDSAADMTAGTIIFITDGSTNANTSWVNTDNVTTVGTDPVIFIQFSQSFPLSMANGGTSASLTPTANSLVYSTSTQMALLASANNGVLVTNGSGVPSISSTLPSGLSIPGYATSGANTNITSLTGITGKIQAPTAIASSAGLDVLAFTYAASAVNNLVISNSATGNAVPISVTGSDTNINLQYVSKGTGQHRFLSEDPNPISFFSGTSYQHTTRFNFANTSAVRDVTFQDATGTVAYTADIDWELVATDTANNTSSTMSFTNLTGYRNYKIVIVSLLPATNGAALSLLVSTNNGVSYLNSASDYFFQIITAVNTLVSAGSSIVATAMPFTPGGSNLTGAGYCGELLVSGVLESSRKGFVSSGVFLNTTPAMQSYDCRGIFTTGSVINAVRIITSSGNLFSGNVYVYGMR